MPTPSGPEQWYCSLTCTADPRSPNCLQFKLERYIEQSEDRSHAAAAYEVPIELGAGEAVQRARAVGLRVGSAPGALLAASLVAARHAEPPALQWHHLELTITADQFRITWDHRSVHAISRAEIQNVIPLWTRELAKLRPLPGAIEFPPRGSVGLLMEKTSAEFHSVVLRPLVPR